MRAKLDLVQWSDTLLINHKKIDEQHKRLVRLFNKFLDCINNEETHTQIRNAFAGMLIHTESHYRAEEVMMQEINYPLFAEHCVGHRAFENEFHVALELFKPEDVDMERVRELAIKWTPFMPMRPDDLDLVHYVQVLNRSRDSKWVLHNLLKQLAETPFESIEDLAKPPVSEIKRKP